jgi:peroxin-2
MTQPASWQQLWDQAQSTLSNAERSLASTSSPVTSRVLRVGQLDAELLDIELVNLLRDPLSKALGLVHVRPPRLTVPSWLCPPEASDGCGFRVQSTLKSRFEPELSLFIQLTLYRLSVWATGASYGAKLQDLKYTYTASSASNARVLCTCNHFCHGALIAFGFTVYTCPSSLLKRLPRCLGKFFSYTEP